MSKGMPSAQTPGSIAQLELPAYFASVARYEQIVRRRG